MDLLRSQVRRPFPTPGSGTLWVAGESLRGRSVSCLPRWTVCPTRSPSLGSNRSTCRGECSWSGPLVTPPGRCHRGPLTNGPGRIPPYCVCSGGADTVTGGGPKPLRLGPSPASPVGPFRPAPLFAVWFVVVGFPSLPGGVVVVVGRLFAFPGRVACVRVPASPGCGSPPVAAGAPLPLLAEGPLVLVGGGPSPLLAEVRRFAGRGPSLRAVGSGWAGVPPPLLAEGPGCGPPPLPAGGPLGLVVGGPSPLLVEGPGRGSPPLLAGVLWCWWGVGLRHSWLRSADLRGVVRGLRLWVLGGCSLATPG